LRISPGGPSFLKDPGFCAPLFPARNRVQEEARPGSTPPALSSLYPTAARAPKSPACQSWA
jgi:hypothetical protein